MAEQIPFQVPFTGATPVNSTEQTEKSITPTIIISYANVTNFSCREKEWWKFRNYNRHHNIINTRCPCLQIQPLLWSHLRTHRSHSKAMFWSYQCKFHFFVCVSDSFGTWTTHVQKKISSGTFFHIDRKQTRHQKNWIKKEKKR